MKKIERIKKVCKWLILTDYADSNAGIAKKMGYSRSSFSQIMNEKVPLSDKFIDAICSADINVNREWVKTEKGAMIVIKDDYGISYIDKADWFSIKLAEKSIEIDSLKTTIKELEGELKKCK